MCVSSRPYEAAYALYRLGQHAKVLQLAASAGDASPQWQWLQAQAQFRGGDMTAAQASYAALRASAAAHDAEVEATVNYTAACIAGGQDTPPSIKPEGGADFEVAFNVATARLQRGDAVGAAADLTAALASARAALLADGLSGAAADAELLPLQLQSAVAQQCAGDAPGAAAVLRAAQRTAPRRTQASYVAAVNAAVAGGSRELFAAFTAVKAALAAADDAKLSPAQRRTLQVNRALLLAHLGKGGEAAALGGQLLAEGGAHGAHLEALLAALDPAAAGQAPHQRVAAAAAQAATGHMAGAAAALHEAAIGAEGDQLPALVAAYVHWSLQGGEEPDAVATACVALLGGRPAGDDTVAARAAAVQVLHGAAHAAAAASVLHSGSIGTDADSALLATLVRAAAGSVTELPPAPPGVTVPPLASLLTGALPWVGTAGAGTVAPPTLPVGDSAAPAAGSAAAVEGTVLSPAQARASRRQAARLRRRSKLRAAHMEKLRNKAVYRSGAAIPKPDPERWLPFKARSYDRFGNLKRRPKAAAGAAYKNTGSSQGLAGGDSAKAASALDAKAAADARGSGGGAAAGVKGSTKAAPKVAAGLGKKKKRGKRR